MAFVIRIKGLKKPPPQPKLISFSVEDEQAIYAATDEPYRDFLFAAIYTGCAAVLRAGQTDCGTCRRDKPRDLWRVYSTKTKKVRKIPVRPEVATLTRKRLANAPKAKCCADIREPTEQTVEEGHWSRAFLSDPPQTRLEH